MGSDSARTACHDKILVVDDDEFVCNSLKWLLLDEGYDVEVAGDGKVRPFRFVSNFTCPSATAKMV